MNASIQNEITILGAGGMLGTSLRIKALEQGIPVNAFSRAELDICDADAVMNALPGQGVVVNCAAWTDVDGAESHEQEAAAVNAVAPGLIAERCAALSIRMVHVSTDYVFDGRSDKPYAEEDACAPLNAYGRTKRAGEQAVLAAHPGSMVVRTQGLYGAGGKNFVDTIRGRLMAGEPVQVVDDQFVAPLWTHDLATAILISLQFPVEGLLHLVAGGAGSWYDVACEIGDVCGHRSLVSATDSSAYQRAATRPVRAVLDTTRYAALTGEQMPLWQDSLQRYLRMTG